MEIEKYQVNAYLYLTCWWCTYPSKNMKISRDIFPNTWTNKIHVPNHQPVNNNCHRQNQYYDYHLVGGFNHFEKYESMGRIIPCIMENKTCLKPPTSDY
jgi:hypothetical protein